jgi:hypothetical protein
VAKAKRKRTPSQRLRQLVASDPDTVVALARHFDHQEKDRRNFERAAESVLNVISQRAPALTAGNLATALRPIVEAVGRRQVSSESPTGAGIWLSAEARRLKAANAIPADIRPTDFARMLERQMRKAAGADGFARIAGTDKLVRVVGSRHIKNSLRAWRLWPINSIR